MSIAVDLFSPFKLGPYELPNRIVMPPLTRSRAGEGNVPGPMNATYYAQRASAGLIITECTQVSPQGSAYPYTPGIHSAEQVAGWRHVTDAVHQRGGKIFLQIWHGGRVSHPSLQPNGELPVGPSAIAIAEGQAFTYKGLEPFVTPRALEKEEIPVIVEQFSLGAEYAMSAGFDGVEIHGANGYLLDQFLHDGSNQRTDEYGGSIENRARLLLEVTEAVTGVWGAGRVGVRLSPGSTWMSMYDSDKVALFNYVVDALNRFDLAYLSLIEPTIAGNITIEAAPSALAAKHFRTVFKGPLLAAGDYTRERGDAALAAGDVDLVGFGRLFIANPDLPERFAAGASLKWPSRERFYGGGGDGYTDYPTLRDEAVYEDVRRRIFSRDFNPDDILTADNLSSDVEIQRSLDAYALNRLADEGLISREPEGHFAVIPVETNDSDEAFDARCAVELGVAYLTVGRISTDDLEGLKERLEIMKPLIAEDRFVDFGRYLEANNDYHEYLVGLAKNDKLLDSYRTIGMKGLMARALGGSEKTSDKVIADHMRLTESYERGDLEGAKTAIREHAALAKARARSVLETAGGRI